MRRHTRGDMCMQYKLMIDFTTINLPQVEYTLGYKQNKQLFSPVHKRA